MKNIMRLLVMVAALSLARAEAQAAPLFELLEMALDSAATGKRGESAALVLRVGDDGRWEAAGGKRGAMAPDRRSELERVIKDTKLALAASFNACDALATSQLTLITPRGKLTWSAPCNPPPDAATQKLIDLAMKLTVGR